jgi:chitin synthase
MINERLHFSQRTLADTKAWDVFRDLPPRSDSGSMTNQACLEFTVRVLKILAYIVTFAIVLICGVIAKSSMFFMTSQIRADRVVTFCNKELSKIAYTIERSECIRFNFRNVPLP